MLGAFQLGAGQLGARLPVGAEEGEAGPGHRAPTVLSFNAPANTVALGTANTVLAFWPLSGTVPAMAPTITSLNAPVNGVVPQTRGTAALVNPTTTVTIKGEES